MKSQLLFKWKPVKWWLVSLLALAIAVWLSSSTLPVLASPETQAIFKIGDDLVIAESQTVQDAFVIGGDATLQRGAQVQGDIFAIGGNLQLEEDTRVEGDAFAVGGQIIRAESAVVRGSEFTLLEDLSGVFNRFGVFGVLYLTNLVFWLAGFAIAAIAGLLLLLLLPNHVNAINSAVQLRPLSSLIYGVGGLVAVLILTVLTAGSALGSIFIPLANLAVLITGVFGGTATCVWLGKRLQSQRPTAYFRHFWLGLVLLLIISLIPIAGGLLVSFIGLFGFGATLLTRYGTQPANMLLSQLERSDLKGPRPPSAPQH